MDSPVEPAVRRLDELEVEVEDTVLVNNPLFSADLLASCALTD